jgi:hypothetical protein
MALLKKYNKNKIKTLIENIRVQCEINTRVYNINGK